MFQSNQDSKWTVRICLLWCIVNIMHVFLSWLCCSIADLSSNLCVSFFLGKKKNESETNSQDGPSGASQRRCLGCGGTLVLIWRGVPENHTAPGESHPPRHGFPLNLYVQVLVTVVAWETGEGAGRNMLSPYCPVYSKGRAMGAWLHRTWLWPYYFNHANRHKVPGTLDSMTRRVHRLLHLNCSWVWICQGSK